MTAASRHVRISRKTDEAQDTCSFELIDTEGGGLPPFSAGSHIDVHVAEGLVRQYSLCNDPRETHRYLIAVLREPASRGGSVAMHAMQEGQELRISEPKNHFSLAHDSRHSVLLAGGIGITPILCMAERLSMIGASFEMHYCTRSPDRTAFAERIRASSFADRVHLHHDSGPATQKLDIAATLASPQAGAHLYVCGPSGFMDAVLSAARAAGWTESCLHREYFAGAAADTTHDGTFEVQLASTGAVIRVAADQTVVAALAAVGVRLPVSCEQGVCGTCLTRVIDGTPDHRDMYLTDEEQARGDQFTPCCSRAKTPRLVLDL
ncbi:PDR/VanB family oxidoreductase [Ramlibacter sp. WS9]|uniref:PDR/VanB family oxidoreductase n=1 Tax=Ramlibacter sp. WS9 TaxID=1882741 RepID=UPI001141ADEF|nr:PDR/VanB family oxidoreductase [Ramlibacter sp. WS9]ROZ75075.1 oxidoreductase [Ramlibacter sp. WS9]